MKLRDLFLAIAKLPNINKSDKIYQIVGLAKAMGFMNLYH